MVLIKYFRYLIFHTLKIEESLYLFGFKIKLPRSSKLLIYREKFKNYDFFLHFTVKDFKRGVVVLAIGVNVGDTFFPNLKKDRIYYFDILTDSQNDTHRMQMQVNNYKSIVY